ncbi:MAG TPA: cupredoxin domain-containing protein [Chloroflexota bacterium]|nr:cupredoxin domain-containing protein [Chloroflexota bacterium]
MTPRHLRDRLTAALRLGVLACGAFALGSNLLAPAPAGAQGQPITVEMGERGNAYFFAPEQLSASAGTVNFVFRNSGTREHNFVIEALNLRTPDIPAGATRDTSFTFTTPGTYVYICDLPTHAQRGMRGQIVIAAAGAAPAAQATAAPGTQATVPGATQATVPATGATQATATRPAQATVPPGTSTGSVGAVPSSGNLPLFVSLAIHIPAAVAWLGVVLYQAVVAAVPYLSVSQRADLLRRPRWLILAVIPLFAITGTYQTINNPFVTITDFETAEAFRATSAYAQALFWKHGFVLLSMALTLAVTFWLAPRLAQSAAPVAIAPGAGPGPGATTVTIDAADGEGSTGPASPGRVSLLAWANVASCLALLLCVAVMVFQLH